MDINTDWYEILDNLIDDLDQTANTQPLQLARLNSTSTTTTTLGSDSPLVIHDYDDNDYNFGVYEDITTTSSSLDIQPLVVNFDDDMIIEI